MQAKGSVIAITGAAGGLGCAIALQLARSGAELVLIDRDAQRLEVLVAACRKLRVKANTCVCDISNEDQVESCFEAIRRESGRLDVLVNNAGILRDGLLIKPHAEQPPYRMTLDQWQSVIDTNLTGTFLCGREAAWLMAKQGQGLIINISSVARAGNRGQSNYAAAKAGVASLVVCWARELAEYGVRVAGIAPGVIDTEMVRAMKPEARERLLKTVPLGRPGEPAEVAHAVEYLIASEFFTGRLLELDGGLRL